MDAVNAYSCACSPGWMGVTCDISKFLSKLKKINSSFKEYSFLLATHNTIQYNTIQYSLLDPKKGNSNARIP